MLRAEHHELGALGVLLRHLLRLDGARVLHPERQVRQRDILQHNPEILRAFPEREAHPLAHLVAHGEELIGVELRHRGFQNLVADGGQHALLVLGAEVRVDLGQPRDFGAVQHAQREVHLLQVLRARHRGDGLRAGADVVDGGVLDERHQEVRALAHGFRQHAAETIEHHRALAAVHCAAVVETGSAGSGGVRTARRRGRRVAGVALESTRRARDGPGRSGGIALAETARLRRSRVARVGGKSTHRRTWTR